MNEIRRTGGHRCEVADLASKLRFAEALLEADRIVAFDKPDPERRWYEVFSRALHLLMHILAVHNSLYMLSDCCVGTYRETELSLRQPKNRAESITYTVLVH